MNCKTCKYNIDGYCHGKTFLSKFPDPVKISDDFACSDYERKNTDCDIYIMNFYGRINHKRNEAFLKELEPLLEKYGLSIMVAHDPKVVKKTMDWIEEFLEDYRNGGGRI